MKPYAEASYIAQVRRLTALAKNALERYPVRVARVEFITHGENTTFKVTAKNGKKYLLRVHRPGYHTRDAIQEELNWLAILSQRNKTPVPTPVRSKHKRFIESAEAAGIPEARYCCLLRWIDGRFLKKSLNAKHMFALGELIAELHKSPPRTRHRRYWQAEGLVGTRNPKFGSLGKLEGIRAKDLRIIENARRGTFAKLKAFEKKFPKRQGLIHTDLHFGNVLDLGNRLGAIDFDDCGYGFYAYDLAAPLISAEYLLGKNKFKKRPELKTALIAGYSSHARWDTHDEKILPELITARKIMMLGWLNSRADNPRLRKYLKTAVKRFLG